MSQAPEDSPNELTPAPHVRRLNRVPLLIAGVLLSVLLAAVAYSYYARLAKTTGKPEEEQKPEAAPVLLKDAPDAGFIPREKETPRPAVAPLPKEPRRAARTAGRGAKARLGNLPAEAGTAPGASRGSDPAGGARQYKHGVCGREAGGAVERVRTAAAIRALRRSCRAPAPLRRSSRPKTAISIAPATSATS